MVASSVFGHARRVDRFSPAFPHGGDFTGEMDGDGRWVSRIFLGACRGVAAYDARAYSCVWHGGVCRHTAYCFWEKGDAESGSFGTVSYSRCASCTSFSGMVSRRIERTFLVLVEMNFFSDTKKCDILKS